MDRKTTEELNELSKKAFGSSSRWRKFMEKGVMEPMSRQREVTLPTKNGGLEIKVFTDHKSIIKRYTVDEIRDLMKALTVPPKHATSTVQAIDLDGPFSSEMTVKGAGIPEGTTVK